MRIFGCRAQPSKNKEKSQWEYLPLVKVPGVFYYTKEHYMKYTFLSSKFYNDYPHSKYPQMEIKDNRPYAHVTINAYNHLFCLPLRSNIDHPHAYFTN